MKAVEPSGYYMALGEHSENNFDMEYMREMDLSEGQQWRTSVL